MLTPTIEAVARRAYSRAALPLEVKIEVALRVGVRVHHGDRLLESPTGAIEATGPKISSRPIVIVGETLVEERRPEEVTVRAIRDRVPAAVEDQPGALRDPCLDVAEDALPMRRADDRAHRDARRRRRRRPGAPAPTPRDGPAPPRGRADRSEHASGEAALAGAAVEGLRDDVDRPVEIGVGHDDDEVLRAAEGLDALAGVRRPPVDRLRDLRRAHERDGADAGMVADRLDDVARRR